MGANGFLPYMRGKAASKLFLFLFPYLLLSIYFFAFKKRKMETGTPKMEIENLTTTITRSRRWCKTCNWNPIVTQRTLKRVFCTMVRRSCGVLGGMGKQ
jgi:hypothetical protein